MDTEEAYGMSAEMMKQNSAFSHLIEMSEEAHIETLQEKYDAKVAQVFKLIQAVYLEGYSRMILKCTKDAHTDFKAFNKMFRQLIPNEKELEVIWESIRNRHDQ